MEIWVAGAALLLLFIGLLSYLFTKEPEEVVPAPVQDSQPLEKPKEPAKAPEKSSKPAKTKLVHPELADSYKNLQSGVVDFCIQPGYLAVCCEDSTLRIYKQASILDTKAKYVQGLLAKNQPTALALGTNGNWLYVAGSQDLQIHFFKVQSLGSKFSLEEEKVFAKKHYIRVSSLAFTPTCLISCGEEQDTTIYIWSHSGDLLYSHENKQLKHKRLVISRDFKFFSIATWLGSARIFEILKEKKTQNFEGVHVVMELGGHSQGLNTLGFSPDSTLAVTCSLDRTVKLWNIKVQYEFKEHPVLLKTLKLDADVAVPNCCAVNDKRMILGCEDTLRIYSVPELEIVKVIKNAHKHALRKIEIYENLLVSISSEPRVNLWQID